MKDITRTRTVDAHTMKAGICGLSLSTNLWHCQRPKPYFRQAIKQEHVQDKCFRGISTIMRCL